MENKFMSPLRLPLNVSRGALSVLTLMALAGCNNNPANYPDTAPVTGTVTVDGQPLAGASLTFVPASGRPSSGTTDSSGKYWLRYTGAIEGTSKHDGIGGQSATDYQRSA